MIYTEFLKDILGDELYTQVKLCVENYNNENKDNKISIVNGSEKENKISELEEKLKTEKLNDGVIISLLKAGATDIDYLTYKLNKLFETNNEKPTLDENGKLVNEDKIMGELKKSYPSYFNSQSKTVKENTLNTGETSEISRSDIMKMNYARRVKLFNEEPELYKSAMSKN